MSDLPGQPTLDQLRVLIAVVESGGLAAAGRRLGRATSAISYAIAQLEGQLGLALFDRHATRRPRLTEAGQVVLAEARSVAGSIDGLRAKVKGLLDGLEPELSFVVDALLPAERLVAALAAFQVAFPTVTLRLHVETLGAVGQLVRDGTATLGVAGTMHSAPEGMMFQAIAGVRMVPVAAPGHPLARGRTAPGAAAAHVQLVLSDRSAVTAGKDFYVLGSRSWRIADLGTKHRLLLAGVGWGGMPEALVRDDLAAGRLVRLSLPDWADAHYRMALLHRVDTPPGPAARWLMARFLAEPQRSAAA
ncbi:LysR family transcriptional regulator [alpha proteobacterium AAP81b]|nr:LysR family transcriptional regulator [alpha proteobacterium AAP81b]